MNANNREKAPKKRKIAGGSPGSDDNSSKSSADDADQNPTAEEPVSPCKANTPTLQRGVASSSQSNQVSVADSLASVAADPSSSAASADARAAAGAAAETLLPQQNLDQTNSIYQAAAMNQQFLIQQQMFFAAMGAGFNPLLAAMNPLVMVPTLPAFNPHVVQHASIQQQLQQQNAAAAAALANRASEGGTRPTLPDSKRPAETTANTSSTDNTKHIVPQFDSLEQRLQVIKPVYTNDGTVSESFPARLHRLLLELETNHPDGAHIASFLPDGNAFLILNPYRFENEVMKHYWPRMGSFASFQRQLNLYDFKRISSGPNKGAYTHPCFMKQYPLLSRSMKRTKLKNVGGKAVAQAKSQDDNEDE